jgi:hypothetical protein
MVDEKVTRVKRSESMSFLNYIHFVKGARKARDEEWAFGRVETKSRKYKKR